MVDINHGSFFKHFKQIAELQSRTPSSSHHASSVLKPTDSHSQTTDNVDSSSIDVHNRHTDITHVDNRHTGGSNVDKHIKTVEKQQSNFDNQPKKVGTQHKKGNTQRSRSIFKYFYRSEPALDTSSNHRTDDSFTSNRSVLSNIPNKYAARWKSNDISINKDVQTHQNVLHQSKMSCPLRNTPDTSYQGEEVSPEEVHQDLRQVSRTDINYPCLDKSENKVDVIWNFCGRSSFNYSISEDSSKRAAGLTYRVSATYKQLFHWKIRYTMKYIVNIRHPM